LSAYGLTFNRAQWRKIVLGLSAAASALWLVGISGPAQAADAIVWVGTRYSSGTYHHYVVIAYDADTYHQDSDPVQPGHVYMDSDPISLPLEHKIGVCDSIANGVAVYMRVYPTSGGSIDYEDDTTHDNPCHTFTLGVRDQQLPYDHG
jgi:hypothetical protein